MKKWFLSALMIMPGMLFAQNDNFEIKGRTVDVPEGYIVGLSYVKDGAEAMDTAHVRADHTYLIQGSTTGCEASLLLYKPGDRNMKGMVPFFLSADNMEVVHAQSFSNATITGSDEFIAYKKVNATFKSYNEKITDLGDMAEAARGNGNAKQAARFEAEMNALKQEQMDKAYADYIRQHPSSPVAVFALKRYALLAAGKQNNKVRTLYGMLSESMATLPSARGIIAKMDADDAFNETAGIGKVAPDFEQADTSGNMVKLSSFRGKYVLLDFWASWCGPCRADNPNIVKAYDQYHAKGFEILSVSLDQPGAKDKWLKAIHDDKLAWTHVSDLQYWGNAVAKMYGIQGIPQNFLIDPDGKIIARSLRGDALETELKKIYNQ